MAKRKKAFAIFEGGGVKGVAHIGALKAIEEHDIELVGVAGTSAGSIIASLIAVGYQADELLKFDPNSPNGLFDVSLKETFLDNDELKRAEEYKAKLKWLESLVKAPRSFMSVGGIWDRTRALTAACVPIGVANWWLKGFTRVFKEMGVVGTERFGNWLNSMIVKRLTARNCPNVPERPTFRYLSDISAIPLKMVAANATRRTTMVYETQSTPDTAVADAVQASIAIPYLFRPRRRDSALFVDGGIVSNYPVWIFDNERDKEHRFVPTLGFQLALPESQSETLHDDISEPLHHFWSLISIALFGDYSLERRGVKELHDFKVPVSLGVAQFDATKEQVSATASGARESVAKRLRQVAIVFPPNDEEMTLLLKNQSQVLLRELELDEAKIHIRANVFLKTGADRLTLHYAYNMDGSPELGIEFFRSTGGCGICWEQLAPLAVNLKDAREQYGQTWKMSRLQQNRIRKELNSLLCIPLFCRRILNDNLKECIGDPMRTRNTLEQAFLGVLCFDSDTIGLYDVFSRQAEHWNHRLAEQIEGAFRPELLVNKLAKPVAEALRG